MNKRKLLSSQSALTRLIVAAIVGTIVAGVLVSVGVAHFALLIGWDAAALVYVLWVWISVLQMNAVDTKAHAVQENPGRAAADTLLLIASVVSLGTIAFLLIHAGKAPDTEKILDISLGFASVIISWAVVHTLFSLRYARIYYGGKPGGIDFNDTSLPKYTDFAYLAFTIGMTYQVSDTSLKTQEMRSLALKHALLSYVFGTVVIVTTINTLASLMQ